MNACDSMATALKDAMEKGVTSYPQADIGFNMKDSYLLIVICYPGMSVLNQITDNR